MEILGALRPDGSTLEVLPGELRRMARRSTWHKERASMSARTRPLKISLDEGRSVSGLLQEPRRPLACCVLAHGAGAGMTHPFMAAVAEGLAGRQVATLRYQFPYMERGSKRPDAPGPAQATVRAAVAEASSL